MAKSWAALLSAALAAGASFLSEAPHVQASPDDHAVFKFPSSPSDVSPSKENGEPRLEPENYTGSAVTAAGSGLMPAMYYPPPGLHFGQSSCYEYNVDYYGHDIQKIEDGTIRSPQACQQKCAQTPKCAYWTFVPDTYSCYLKDKGATQGRKCRPSAVSGPRVCGSPYSACYEINTSYNGYNEKVVDRRVQSAEECHLLCLGLPRCEFWTWDASEGNCYLKNGQASGSRAPAVGCISGPRLCISVTLIPAITCPAPVCPQPPVKPLPPPCPQTPPYCPPPALPPCPPQPQPVPPPSPETPQPPQYCPPPVVPQCPPTPQCCYPPAVVPPCPPTPPCCCPPAVIPPCPQTPPYCPPPALPPCPPKPQPVPPPSPELPQPPQYCPPPVVPQCPPTPQCCYPPAVVPQCPPTPPCCCPPAVIPPCPQTPQCCCPPPAVPSCPPTPDCCCPCPTSPVCPWTPDPYPPCIPPPVQVPCCPPAQPPCPPKPAPCPPPPVQPQCPPKPAPCPPPPAQPPCPPKPAPCPPPPVQPPCPPKPAPCPPPPAQPPCPPKPQPCPPPPVQPPCPPQPQPCPPPPVQPPCPPQPQPCPPPPVVCPCPEIPKPCPPIQPSYPCQPPCCLPPPTQPQAPSQPTCCYPPAVKPQPPVQPSVPCQPTCPAPPVQPCWPPQPNCCLPPPSPPCQPDYSHCFYKDVALEGTEVQGTSKVCSAVECQQLCQKHAACRSFTFIPETQMCNLRTNYVKKVAKPNAVSGPKYCFTLDCELKDVEYYGQKVHEGPADSIFDCHLQCNFNAYCSSATFDSRTRQCTLYQRAGIRTGVVSGQKTCRPSIDTEGPAVEYDDESGNYFCHDPAVAYNSKPMSILHLDAVDECQEACRNHPHCRVFTYFLYGKVCLLFDREAPKIHNVTAVSGPKFCRPTCLRDNVEVHGKTVQTCTTKTAAECQKQCQTNPHCTMFTFEKSTKLCHLKKHRGQAAGKVSAPLTCGERDDQITIPQTERPPASRRPFPPIFLDGRPVPRSPSRRPFPPIFLDGRPAPQS